MDKDSQSSNVGTKIRGMGCHEAYQTAVHALDQYRGTIVTCSYTLPASLDVFRDIAIIKSSVYEAIARVVLAQPHLHVGIKDDHTRNPVFVRIDQLDLREHVEWRLHKETRQFEALFHDCIIVQLDSRYQNLETRPGWKVMVLHEGGGNSLELVYVWNHAHHDGMSGSIFHQQLLRNLNESFLSQSDPLPESTFVEGSERLALKIPDPTSRLPPNPELLSWWPMSPLWFVKTVWKEIKPHWIFPPGNVYAHWAPIRTSPFATRFRNFTIDTDTVAKVVEACRRHDTTLTSLVHALTLVSLTHALPNSRGFASRTPYDLRHVLAPRPLRYPWLVPREAMCNYVSVVEHEFDAQLVATIRSTGSAQACDTVLSTELIDVVWAVAERVRREVKAKLDSGVWNDLIGIMKLCSNWLTQQESEVRKTRYLSWLITNLGVLDGRIGLVEGQDGWSLKRGELFLSTDTPSAALSVSMITVKGGDLVVTCTWQDCAVDADLVERFMRDLKRWIEEIATSG